jgi:predicted type IV restriction endonuclease
MAVDITKDLRKYIPIFQQAYEQNINEAETSLRVGKFLEDVLGYDVFQDITKEHTVKDRFVDYAIKLNGKVTFFIEIKQAGIELREKHIEQASNYAANAGVSWVALTNGRCWQLYHLTFDDGIQSDLILSADFLSGDIKEASSKIGLLHKKSVLKGEHEDFYAKIKVLSPKSIIQAIFQENTLRMIRGHLKRMTGITVDEEDLVAGIKQMLSAEAWKDIGEVRVKRPRKAPRQNKKKQEEQPTAAAISSPVPEMPVPVKVDGAEEN